MNTYTNTVIIYLIFKVNTCFSSYGNAVLQDETEIPCSDTEECHDLGFEGFICKKNKCVQENSVRYLKLGTMVSKIGLPCEDSKDCIVTGSFCKEKQCACKENYVVSEDERKCLKMSFTAGMECIQHGQCFPLNALCINKICKCPDDMHLSKGICFKSVGLGLFCKRDEECLADFSSCVSNKCTCNENYIQSEKSLRCLSKANGILSTCSEDVQCRSTLGFGSFCSRGLCMCKDIFHYKNSTNKCVSDVFLGETCAIHSDCHQPGVEESHLECVLGECKCKPDYTENDGFCKSSSTSMDISIVYYSLLSYMLLYLIA